MASTAHPGALARPPFPRSLGSPQCGSGWAAGRVGRQSTEAKLAQPGTQQVEPVPRTAPPQGDQAWQSLRGQGTQPVPTWLSTFPRCHPLFLLALGQHPGSAQSSWDKKGMLFPHGPWVPRLRKHLAMRAKMPQEE